MIEVHSFRKWPSHHDFGCLGETDHRDVLWKMPLAAGRKPYHDESVVIESTKGDADLPI